jgi:hypothetical protein
VYYAFILTAMDSFITFTVASTPSNSKVEEDSQPNVNDDASPGSSGSCVVA